MPTAKVSEKIAADADAVFAILGDFAGIDGPAIENKVIEGEGLGMTRTLTIGGGTVVERMDNHDPASRTLTYSIQNDDCPLPFAGYGATLKDTPTADQACQGDWFGNFRAKGVPDADAIEIAKGIYLGMIKAVQKQLLG